MSRFWDRRANEDALYFVDSLGGRAATPEEFWRGGERVLNVFEEKLDVKLGPTDEVVEIGCGVGRVTRVLATRAARVRALDVSARMLEQAREHNPQLDNVEWIFGDGVSLAPVADASVDVCFSHVVFQHIPDPEITLGYVTEMGRVLRPGGWAAFHVSDNPAVHKPRVSLGKRALALLGFGPRGQGHPAWLGSPVNLDDLRARARDAGLDVGRIVGEGTQWCLVLLRRPA